MNVSKSTWIKVGVSAAVVTAVAMAVPKAASALVAALVQVVNTASNPVVSQDVAHTASQIVELQGATGPTQTHGQQLYLISPGAANVGLYTVPSGQSLVVTSVEVVPNVSTGYTDLELNQGVDGRDYWQISNAAPTTQLVFPSGIVLQAGSQPTILVPSGFGNPQSLQVYVRGYLTAN